MYLLFKTNKWEQKEISIHNRGEDRESGIKIYWINNKWEVEVNEKIRSTDKIDNYLLKLDFLPSKTVFDEVLIDILQQIDPQGLSVNKLEAYKTRDYLEINEFFITKTDDQNVLLESLQSPLKIKMGNNRYAAIYSVVDRLEVVNINNKLFIEAFSKKLCFKPLYKIYPVKYNKTNSIVFFNSKVHIAFYINSWEFTIRYSDNKYDAVSTSASVELQDCLDDKETYENLNRYIKNFENNVYLDNQEEIEYFITKFNEVSFIPNGHNFQLEKTQSATDINNILFYQMDDFSYSTGYRNSDLEDQEQPYRPDFLVIKKDKEDNNVDIFFMKHRGNERFEIPIGSNASIEAYNVFINKFRR